ncbi:hypothetical protein PC113_g17407 [Phytophthora cactorum]|uniref:Uncharacterized protein n=1 Tax=Phytophthora cactorum TaxID=29920 RepID=A0A8T0YQW8_9STRA|nr:hypothetical protein PC113_g17407 [Phytophthora cactorum]
MKDVRRDEAVLKEAGELALERMVQRIAIRYGFSSQKPQAAKKSPYDGSIDRARRRSKNANSLYHSRRSWWTYRAE